VASPDEAAKETTAAGTGLSNASSTWTTSGAKSVSTMALCGSPSAITRVAGPPAMLPSANAAASAMPSTAARTMNEPASWLAVASTAAPPVASVVAVVAESVTLGPSPGTV